jgi:hypothetical protein
LNYKNYSRVYHEVVDLTRTLNAKRRELDLITAGLKNAGGEYGIEFSAHAIANISTRLEELASDDQIIYDDVFRPDSLLDALIIPSNLKSFVISLLSQAIEEGAVEQRNSKSNGIEYHHVTRIKKWSVAFTCIVEDNTIKTGYFNNVNNDV